VARRYFKVATFNVRNLISPGVTYYRRNRYSEAAYNQKLDWLADQLYRMDADIVCLQECFDEPPLVELQARHRALVEARDSKARAGRSRYRHLWHLANVDADEGNPLPGLAILSRNKILEQVALQDLTADPIEIEPDDGLSYRLDKLSRPIQIARIELPEGVEGWFFNAHLKSKRPKYASGSDAGDPGEYQFFERAQGNFRSLALRAGEALALRRALLDKLVGSDQPVFVLGDLNDEIGAVTTEMVAGEMPWRAWPFAIKSRYWDVELYSAVRSHLRRTEHSSIHTHIFNGHYGTIDHVLISQELYYRNTRRIGDVHFVEVFNDHLIDDSVQGAPSERSASDHGQVVVRCSIDPERLEARRSGEFEIFRDDDGKFRFVLKASNGRVIAESQAYRSRTDALRGIQSIRNHVRDAGVDDKT
jgi:uncharacterized protein YegP (UPF0339 family)/endonuclease/exonuclease/phosphatase family metal-dependent hydrolase